MHVVSFQILGIHAASCLMSGNLSKSRHIVPNRAKSRQPIGPNQVNIVKFHRVSPDLPDHRRISSKNVKEWRSSAYLVIYCPIFSNSSQLWKISPNVAKSSQIKPKIASPCQNLSYIARLAIRLPPLAIRRKIALLSGSMVSG